MNKFQAFLFKLWISIPRNFRLAIPLTITVYLILQVFFEGVIIFKNLVFDFSSFGYKYLITYMIISLVIFIIIKITKKRER
ncbi:hypothetical protein [Bacillus cytotoxicus]|uniref:hypothetical protein n=1 Tax=Bacillus cytotoxicus TaxID=580165 RepID=UPI0008642546|nr:hypothetical protein [Bacillus cytotoxicus]AWC29014.1 hypothetical protein CG483_012170 [Bacillus cytotoxicus]AWC39600.1 hypothetical protein CG480_003080 [Bacillus cytotoxicus]AWC47531.1 hypothetical protein CG478_003080 [Bacillus cytotoxicus]AWC53085.1 hypothetical protein CG477_012130 [Bacillus cytotoxicus]AWC57214.1 hypothetical protein CG476_012155 [Bacillus cytotoxicus]